jgi:hypothetical protein
VVHFSGFARKNEPPSPLFASEASKKHFYKETLHIYLMGQVIE